MCDGLQGRSLQVSRQFSVAVIQDVKRVIHGPNPRRFTTTFTMAALSEVIRMLEKANKELNKGEKCSQIVECWRKPTRNSTKVRNFRRL